MDDRERLTEFIAKLSNLPGLGADSYRRLTNELERRTEKIGYDKQGRLKVAFFDVRNYDIRSFEDHNGDRFAFQFLPAALSEETALAASGCRVVCIFVNDRCDVHVIGQLAALGVELIALRCSGFNNVDLKACAKHSIDVVRVPVYSPYAVAEHTVGLMLMLNRRLHQAYVRNRTGYFVLDGLTGFDMKGKTAGVIGTGQIGRCLVDILLGFGCRVLAFDKFPDPSISAKENLDYVELNSLFHESDIISLHVPLFPETYHLINRASIEMMKPGVMLINTSRGGLVDTKALIEGLKSGKIGYAGLDVYEEEAGIFFRDMSDTVLTDDVLARLLTFNNVVITSHQAFLTKEALGNIAETTLANIVEFDQCKRGRELTNLVSLD